MVLNGDVITNMDIKQMYKKKNAIALIELKTKYGTVSIHEDRITEFREKKSVPDVWMNAGIYHLDRSIVEKLPTNGAIEKTVFLKYAKEGKLHGVKFRDSFWFSIDSHKDLEDCSETLQLQKI
ncbi:nucleotidyltransferase family protein [Candidatus Nitrosotenuis chungbukensis]|uniref:nucleotidyltransferase family protein n=1 Tax=Candidatus Nitrosotenuis chungbukensis TaxID=1353246 RepID=UPI002A4E1B4C|nr:sugar phosphate nucleotidyltransferase [Candidatus Nitrosotenuis chungbukensis]